jgi:hypothetical protein
MENSEIGDITDIKSHRRRSIIRRLWESYAVDLITILQAANDGKCSQLEARQAMAELVPMIKMLRDGGKFEQILKKADLVILDKVFNDVNSTENFDLNQVDLEDL